VTELQAEIQVLRAALLRAETHGEHLYEAIDQALHYTLDEHARDILTEAVQEYEESRD
jgi:ribosome-associated translation inhibitor RaiA